MALTFRHLGNVLVRETYRADIRIDSKTKLETAGILCSIIDFSFSRLKSAQGEILFCDLSQEGWLFEGSSDSGQQYEMYRMMKSFCHNGWAEFHPETNLLWLGHILSSLLIKLPVPKRRGQLFDQLSKLEQSIGTSIIKTVHDVVVNRNAVFQSCSL